MCLWTATPTSIGRCVLFVLMMINIRVALLRLARCQYDRSLSCASFLQLLASLCLLPPFLLSLNSHHRSLQRASNLIQVHNPLLSADKKITKWMHYLQWTFIYWLNVLWIIHVVPIRKDLCLYYCTWYNIMTLTCGDMCTNIPVQCMHCKLVHILICLCTGNVIC